MIVVVGAGDDGVSCYCFYMIKDKFDAHHDR